MVQLQPTLGALAGLTPAAKAARDILSSSGVGPGWGAVAAELVGAAVCGEGGLKVSHGGSLWPGSGLHGMACGAAAAAACVPAALACLLAGLGFLTSAPSLLGLTCKNAPIWLVRVKAGRVWEGMWDANHIWACLKGASFAETQEGIGRLILPRGIMDPNSIYYKVPSDDAKQSTSVVHGQDQASLW